MLFHLTAQCVQQEIRQLRLVAKRERDERDGNMDWMHVANGGSQSDSFEEKVQSMTEALHGAIERDCRRQKASAKQIESNRHLTFVSDCGLDVAYNVVRVSDALNNAPAVVFSQVARDSDVDAALGHRQKIGSSGEFASASMLVAKQSQKEIEEAVGFDIDMFGSAARAHLVRRYGTLAFLALHTPVHDPLRQFRRPERRHLKPWRNVDAIVCDGVTAHLQHDERAQERHKQLSEMRAETAKIVQSRKDAFFQKYVSTFSLYRLFIFFVIETIEIAIIFLACHRAEQPQPRARCCSQRC